MTASRSLDPFLETATKADASDLHLTAGMRPMLRQNGILSPTSDDELAADRLEAMTDDLLNEAQKEILESRGALDLARTGPDGTRFRINVFRERGRIAFSIRRIPDRIRSLEELHLPPQLDQLTDLHDGLVIVTGPTGSGKTTTLATLLDGINRARPCHILTLEDPIEFLHECRQALIRQRELHTDFRTFAEAVRSALREDPDVILVGEMRDTETMRAALMAAETGHLVFSTLHSGDAVGATERFIGAFPSQERAAVRHQMSLVLRAVVAQRLLPPATEGPRVPAVDILMATDAVRNLVRNAKTAQIHSTMESQAGAGMQTLEQSLASLVTRGLVTEETARRHARNTSVLETRLRSASSRSSQQSWRS